MTCRVELDWIGGLVQLVAMAFFVSGLFTNHWCESGDVYSGLFQTCNSAKENCFETHDYYSGFEVKGTLMGAAVIEMLVFVGILLSIVCFLCYMFGLFEEKSVGLVTAIINYTNTFFGFIGIIMYGSAASKISYKLSWSFALVILGLLANLTAGIFIHIASQRFKAVRIFDPPLPPGKIHPFTISRPHINRRMLQKKHQLLPL